MTALRTIGAFLLVMAGLSTGFLQALPGILLGLIVVAVVVVAIAVATAILLSRVDGRYPDHG